MYQKLYLIHKLREITSKLYIKYEIVDTLLEEREREIQIIILNEIEPCTERYCYKRDGIR